MFLKKERLKLEKERIRLQELELKKKEQELIMKSTEKITNGKTFCHEDDSVTTTETVRKEDLSAYVFHF